MTGNIGAMFSEWLKSIKVSLADVVYPSPSGEGHVQLVLDVHVPSAAKAAALVQYVRVASMDHRWTLQELLGFFLIAAS